MVTIKYNGMELDEVTEPQIFDPPQEMLVIDEADDKPIKKRVAAILATGYCHNVVATDETFWQSCFMIPEKPAPRRATNRELAKWIAQGYGEMLGDDTCTYILHHHNYPKHHPNDECGGFIMVRKWDDTEWHEPTIDYMRIET